MGPPRTPQKYNSPYLQALGIPLIHPPLPPPPSPRPSYTNIFPTWPNPINVPEGCTWQDHLTHQQNRHAHYTNTARETFLFPRFTNISTPLHVESHLTFWSEEQTRQQNHLTENRDPLSPALRERHTTLLRDTIAYLRDLRVNPRCLGSPRTAQQLGELQWAWDTLCVRMRWQSSPRASQTSSPLGVGSDSWDCSPEAVGGAAVAGGLEVRLPSIGELVEAVEEVRIK